jgi:hypothetical protein
MDERLSREDEQWTNDCHVGMNNRGDEQWTNEYIPAGQICSICALYIRASQIPSTCPVSMLTSQTQYPAVGFPTIHEQLQ